MMPDSKNRRTVSSGTIWENIVGYSRAVRVGNLIEVAGTTAMDEDQIMFPGDPYAQTQYILLKIEQALIDLGASLEDVVRTRIYLTDMDLWEEVAKAHGEVFRQIRPASSMIGIYSLIREDLMVEIEATAFVG
jgi:enamine deaminase RidA (YjgF/YER057c/UK114 family)